MTKAPIPKALREQVWIQSIGKYFESKCTTFWCKNRISVFDFHVGHKVPESKGGPTTIDNLVPICARCNLSMSNNYSTDEWSQAFQKRTWKQFCCCFFKAPSRTNGQGHTQVKGKQKGKGNA